MHHIFNGSLEELSVDKVNTSCNVTYVYFLNSVDWFKVNPYLITKSSSISLVANVQMILYNDALIWSLQYFQLRNIW